MSIKICEKSAGKKLVKTLPVNHFSHFQYWSLWHRTFKLTFPNFHWTISKILKKMSQQMAGPDPISTTCPNCKAEIITTTTCTNCKCNNCTTRSSTSTFQCLVAACLWFFCYFCCFCIPFCMDDWKDVLHTCPNCNYAIGKYKKWAVSEDKLAKEALQWSIQ